MYHYLTGAASWYLLTMITEVFGVYGEMGNLAVEPKLVAEQFDEQGNASVKLHFAGKQLEICYENPSKKDFGEYAIASVKVDGQDIATTGTNRCVLDKSLIEGLDEKVHRICVTLNENK